MLSCPPMGFLEPKTHPAKRYFARIGRMFLLAAAVVLLVTFFGAPDTFGRVAGGLFTSALLGRGLFFMRKVGRVSAKATVREVWHGRSVRYVLEDPGPDSTSD